MEIGFLVLMFVVGAVMGSFLSCQAWRLHYKDQGKKKLGKRSVCLNCGKQIKWYDNIPIVSWLMLGGKCRACKKPIGASEIVIELLSGLAFLGFGSTVEPSSMSVVAWVNFAIMVLLILSLGFLAIYDARWRELPLAVLIFSVICAMILVILKQWSLISVVGFSWGLIFNLLGAVAILGGTYLVLYLLSKGKWVGDGDWILGVALGLALGDSWLALILLFLANFIGCVVMMPRKQKKIAFGPFLVVAFVIVITFAEYLSGLLAGKIW